MDRAMHAAKLTPDARRERAANYERIGANHMTPLWEMLRAVLDGIGGWLRQNTSRRQR
jgi:hypothetical protein